MNRQYGLAIFLALAVLLSVACGKDPTPTPAPTPTTAPTAAPTAVPTVAAATNTPAPTVTPAPTNTPVPTPVITLATNTPAPTLDPGTTLDLDKIRSSRPPHVFVGTAKIDGVAAPSGTIVSVLIEGQTAASGPVGDNGEFETILVDIPGYPVTFKVGDYAAPQSAITTETGGATQLDLNAPSQ